MTSFLRDRWAQAIDGASFGFINLLQARNRAGNHSSQDFEDYLSAWKNKTPQDYYAIPEHTPLPDIPDQGPLQIDSPLPCDHPENNRFHLEIWPGPKGWNSPAMFLLHGVMSVSDVGYRLWAKKLNTLGWTAIFFHLPYHYSRRPERCLSGEIAFSSHLIRTAEGIRQAVVELRLLCQALREKGVPDIGFWATSYGGWIASILISLEKSITTAWLLEPIADADHAIWESPAAITLRRQIGRRGITRSLVERFMPMVCPSHQTPLIPAEKILLIGGIFDKIAPVSSLRQLHKRWTGSHYAEFRQGHVGYQLMPASLRLAQEKMPELFSS